MDVLYAVCTYLCYAGCDVCDSVALLGMTLSGNPADNNVTLELNHCM